MEFKIKIKPLVLFDLEDKINYKEQQSTGSGKQFYHYFLSQLSTLQHHTHEAVPVYQTVKAYIAEDPSCKLFYMVSGETIYVMGLL